LFNVFKQHSVIDLINEAFSQSTIYESGGQKFVLKMYGKETGLVKWFLIKAAGVTTKVYPYAFDPYERMKREIEFFNNLHHEFKTPKVYLIDWVSKTIVREYVDGKPFNPDDEGKRYRELGAILAGVHETGFVLGDTKYHNFLITLDNTYYVVDGEQSIRSMDDSLRYWDIMVFSITTIYGLISKYGARSLKLIEDILDQFIEGYTERGGVGFKKVLLNYNRFNYKALIYVLLPVPYSFQYIRVIEQHI